MGAEKIIDVEAEIIAELRRENCCKRLRELWDLFRRTGDFAWLILWNENRKCCRGEK